MDLMNLVAFVFMFGILIFFHELGHLYVAKKVGILCHEFAIGMGPKIFSWTRNETLYTLRALPIGGYVRMAGEEPEAFELKPGQNIAVTTDDNGLITKLILDNFEMYPDSFGLEVESSDLLHELVVVGMYGEENKTYKVHPRAMYVENMKEVQIAPYNRTFQSKSVGKRALAIAAGPVMNFALAIMLYGAIGMIDGAPVNEAQVGEIVPDMPAEAAGLQEGDVVKTINGDEVSTWDDLQSYIYKSPGETLVMEIDRDGEEITVTVVPNSVTDEATGDIYGQIGIKAPTEKSISAIVKGAVTQTVAVTVGVIQGVLMLVTGQIGIEGLAGPVGIYQMTGEIVENGFTTLLKWTAFLSVNLGIMNLLPIPALDGGRLMFLGVEGVRGKPVSKTTEGFVHFIGFAILMLIMLVVTWNDIMRLFGN